MGTGSAAGMCAAGMCAAIATAMGSGAIGTAAGGEVAWGVQSWTSVGIRSSNSRSQSHSEAKPQELAEQQKDSKVTMQPNRLLDLLRRLFRRWWWLLYWLFRRWWRCHVSIFLPRFLLFLHVLTRATRSPCLAKGRQNATRP